MVLYYGKRKKRTDRSKQTEDKTFKRSQRKRDADDIFLYINTYNTCLRLSDQTCDEPKRVQEKPPGPATACAAIVDWDHPAVATHCLVEILRLDGRGVASAFV